MLKFFISFGIVIGGLFGLAAISVALLLLTTPRPTDIRGCITTKMYNVHLCPQDPNYVPLRNISPNLKNAVIVSEDSTFYQHGGIDWFELRESAEKNWATGQWARGGSTITQQLAKNVYLSADKSLVRKLREVIITLQLEDFLKKDEILEKYLNVVEFGENLYGIGPASKFYFNKTASELTPAEGAFLAFLLPSPKKYSVSFRKKQLTPFARSRMRVIVNRMARFRSISEEQREQGIAQVDSFYSYSGAADTAVPAATGDYQEPTYSDPNEIILPPSEEEGLPADE
jgi:monofunctional glycosyltransferase